MRRTFFLILRATFSLLLTFLSVISWLWYMLAFSDVPPIIVIEDIYVIGSLFVAMIALLIVQVIMIERCKICGSFLLLIEGITSLIIWIATFFGQNFSLVDYSLVCIYENGIIIIGIIIGTFSSVSQSLQILRFYKRRR